MVRLIILPTDKSFLRTGLQVGSLMLLNDSPCRQYLDNTQNKDRSLPAYSLSRLSLDYPIKLHGFLREITVGIDVNNIFNARVATSGWVYSAICESYGHANTNRYYQIGFIPMSGTTALARLSLRF